MSSSSHSVATTAREISGEQILMAMLAACLLLVGTISAAAVLPAAIGVSLAGFVLIATLGGVGAVVRGLLRDSD